MGVGVGPPGPKVSLTRVSPKGEHKTSTRPDDPKGSADMTRVLQSKLRP